MNLKRHIQVFEYFLRSKLKYEKKMKNMFHKEVKLFLDHKTTSILLDVCSTYNQINLVDTSFYLIKPVVSKYWFISNGNISRGMAYLLINYLDE